MTPQDLILAFTRIPATRYLYLGSTDPEDGGIQTITLGPEKVTVDDYLMLSAAIEHLTVFPSSSAVFRVLDDDGDGDTFFMLAWDSGKWYSVPAEMLMQHVKDDPNYLRSKFVEAETVRV